MGSTGPADTPHRAGGAAGGAGNVRRVTSAIVWNFLGKGFVLIVRFAESVILVRLLGREEYGLYGSLVNLEAIVVLVISLGFENALSRFLPQLRLEGDTGKVRSLLRKIFRFRAMLVALAGAALLFGGRFLSETMYHGLLPPGLLNAVAVLVAIVSIHSIFRTVLDSLFHVRLISLVEAATQATYLLIAAGLVLMGFGLGGVFAALIATQGMAALMLWSRFGRALRALPPEGSGSSAVLGKRVIAYSGTLYAFGLLLYVLGKGMDVLLIGVLLGDLSQVAWYIIAFNLAYYSLSLMDIAVSANFVVTLIVEAHASGNPGLLRKIFTGLFEFIYVYALPVAAGGMVLATGVVTFLYGAANAGASVLMLVFVAGMTLSKVSSVTSYFLVVLDREKTLVRARAVFGALNLVLDLALIPKYGALGAVTATSIVMVGIAAFEVWLVGRILAPRYNPAFLTKTIGASVGMAALVWFASVVWEAPPALEVPVLVALGGGIYVVLIRTLRPLSAEVADLLEGSSYPFKPAVLGALGLSRRVSP